MPFFRVILIFSITLLLITWLIGFAKFIESVPTHKRDITQKADTIIVLTGGSERVDYAIELLRNNHANQLFISGVGKDATLNSIINQSKLSSPQAIEALKNHIILGYEAKNTKGNAIESANWLKTNNIQRFILVTANYHMPRSILEFNHLLPQRDLIPAPTVSTNVKMSQWWKYPSSAVLLATEYSKYLAVKLRLLL